MEMSGQFYIELALPLGKQHQLNRRVVRLQRKSGYFGAERILLTLTGIELTFLGRPDCSLIIIPAKLSTCFHYFLRILGVQVKGKLLSLCIGGKKFRISYHSSSFHSKLTASVGRAVADRARAGTSCF